MTVAVGGLRTWPIRSEQPANALYDSEFSGISVGFPQVKAAEMHVIVRDPEVLGGRAVFRGTRVPVEVLFENLADGLSIDEIVESYPSLDRRDVVACLKVACDALLVRG